MKILITNDDGIGSDCLSQLVDWAQRMGNVTVVAPKYEQSGKSHAIELKKPFEIKKTDRFPGVVSYAVDSTPADCIRYAILGLKQNFDLIISGINRGFNLGNDIIYSGTAGAAFEAAYFGINALALSTDATSFASASDHLDIIFKYINDNRLFCHNMIYNINIPPHAKGIRITRQGGPYYSDEFIPCGDNLYMPTGTLVYINTHNPDIDTDAVTDGYISITPLTLCRTSEEAYNTLKKLNG